MKYLLQGLECPDRLALLIEGTDIRSDHIISALEDHYVRGYGAAAAAAMNGVDHGNLSNAQKSLEAEARRIERIKELDWQRHGYQSHCPKCQGTSSNEEAA